MSRFRVLAALTLGTAAAAGALHTTAAPIADAKAVTVAATATPAAPSWGVYIGPGAKNVAGAPRFAAFSNLKITRVVDYPAADNWTNIEAPSWLVAPYTGSGLTVEYSLPLMPDAKAGTSWSLAACARGDYDGHWRTTAQRLVAAKLPTTVIRPGWEFNGTWYPWSAKGKEAAFVGCFRHVVTTMRAVPGSAFLFDWNPNLGPGAFPAEQAYPGDAYVDVIGVDTYDMSWAWYPTPKGMTTETARAKAWTDIVSGNHGLTFWRDFASAHGKPMSLPEWGSTWRSDGHGGGDNPVFVDRMMDWITNPANNVAYAVYFNPNDTATVRHDLMRADSTFPAASVRYRSRNLAYRTGITPDLVSGGAVPAARATGTGSNTGVLATPGLVTGPADGRLRSAAARRIR